MTELPCVLLEKPWDKQADYLRHLAQKDLEVLWYLLQEQGEAFDRLNKAVFAILRDSYETQGTQGTEARP
jgi:hypothetical protein